MLKCVMTNHGKYVRVDSLRRLNLKIYHINTALISFSKAVYPGVISICSTSGTDSSLSVYDREESDYQKQRVCNVTVAGILYLVYSFM